MKQLIILFLFSFVSLWAQAQESVRLCEAEPEHPICLARNDCRGLGLMSQTTCLSTVNAIYDIIASRHDNVLSWEEQDRECGQHELSVGSYVVHIGSGACQRAFEFVRARWGTRMVAYPYSGARSDFSFPPNTVTPPAEQTAEAQVLN